MKADKKKERLAALFGLDVPKPPTKEEQAFRDEVSREAEAVLLFAEDRTKFLQKPCKNCGAAFAVNRTSIAYCSDHCRGVAVREIGLDWNPSARTPEDRWNSATGGREPLIVPPKALELLNSLTQEEAVAG